MGFKNLRFFSFFYQENKKTSKVQILVYLEKYYKIQILDSQ